jgi:hypothetical protein
VLCNFRIEHVDISNMTVGKMDTKTAPNIGISGGLEVACWPLVPEFAGSNPAEAVGFFGRKNPQHVFPRRGSKAVGPTS